MKCVTHRSSNSKNVCDLDVRRINQKVVDEDADDYDNDDDNDNDHRNIHDGGVVDCVDAAIENVDNNIIK